jgi:GNAT superfamily N-acetyltransferase
MTTATTPVDPVSLTVRPMAPDDLADVTEMFRTAGDDALHNRFFTLGDRVVTAHLSELVAPTHPRCHVAVYEGHVVGLVELAPVSSGVEEIAFFVATGLHHHGIGTALMEAAIDDARDRGVRELVADVLATNHLMLEVFAAAGATLAHETDDVCVSLPVPDHRRTS